MYFTPTQRPIDPEAVTLLRTDLDGLFAVRTTELNVPEQGFVRFRGEFEGEIPVLFPEIRSRFERHGFTPLVRDDGQLALIGLPTVFADTPSRWQVNLLLFLATVVMTLFAGALMEAEEMADIWQLWRGWPYSLSVLLILGGHELGHYFAARYHKAPVTLPYFIPFPSLFGTMGAVIRLKGPLQDRRALFDVGAAGPLVGFFIALPILFLGLATAKVCPLPGGAAYAAAQADPSTLPEGCTVIPEGEEAVFQLEGNSVLYALAKVTVFGRFLPDGNTDVILNQLIWAGWTGLFVTGLNLIPAGQLDGGHMAYVLLGERARQLFWPVIIGLLALAIISPAARLIWSIWAALIFFFARFHAEPLDDVTPLDGRRRALALFTLLLFFLTFVPTPIQTIVINGAG